MQKNGVNCSLSCKINSDFYKKAKANNVHCIPLPNYLTCYTNLSTYIKQCKSYDIIHTVDSKATDFALSLRPFHRKPIIYTRRVSYPLHNVLSIIKLKLVDKVTVLTHYYKKYLEGLGLNDISVIPDMVIERDLDTERAKRFVKELGISQNFIIGTISALDDSKDPFTLLRAFKKLSDRFLNVSVLHFGDGKLKGKVMKFIKENNLQNRYFLIGHVDNGEDFYSIFNLFVLCSKVEGMGSSILDAYLYKVPTVVTNIPPIKEYAQYKSVFFEKSDSNSLYTQLNSIVENRPNLTKLTESAYNYVITNHSQQKITTFYLQEYSKLLL